MTSVLTAPRPVAAPAPATAPAPAPVGPRPGRIASDRASTIGRDVGDLVAPWAVGVGALILRLATAASGPTDWDSAQYATAVSRFDVTHGRPQPPGYFLYVVAGRMVHAFGPGTVSALVMVSALASAVAAGLVVVAGRDLGGRWVGLAAGVLVASSPFAWFYGSIVATYSFDLVAAPLLIILAWRARPHSWHGAAALAALGLLAGFRQSASQAFAVLALLAVVASVRRVTEAALAVLAGAVAVAAWFVPMVLAQPGGAAAWSRATRAEALGAIRATSVLDHASGGATNLGTVAAYTSVALAPLAALALLSVLLLGVRGLVRRVGTPAARVDRRGVTDPFASFFSPDPSFSPDGFDRFDRLDRLDGPAPWDPSDRPFLSGSAPDSTHAARPAWTRPWYQSRTAVLAAAIVPPLAVVTLLQFAKGGYLLAYLPGAVIALLLAPAALLRPRATGNAAPRSGSSFATGTWLVVASVAVAAMVGLGAQRFLTGDGVLAGAPSRSTHSVWFTQARYQAPFADTRSAIRSADAIDRSLALLGPFIHPGRDVVAIDSVDGGTTFYRNAGWELPADRVALVVPGSAIYNQQFGSLYYTHTSTVPVGPGGSVYLIAPPSLPGLAILARDLQAVRVPGAPQVADYVVWRVSPGASILGVHVVARSGPRPLGSGLGR